MWRDMKAALWFTAALTLITGCLYPVAVTGLAQALFPRRANGSLVLRDGRVVGSDLIGQSFSGAEYFWSRPSGTTPPYNGGASSGSNLGPTNPALAERVAEAVKALRAAHGNGAIPVDLATASASGLDPDISPAAALYQVDRVARVRGLSREIVEELVRRSVEPRSFGLLGEPRVNVLRLNLALDDRTGPARHPR